MLHEHDGLEYLYEEIKRLEYDRRLVERDEERGDITFVLASEKLAVIEAKISALQAIRERMVTALYTH